MRPKAASNAMLGCIALVQLCRLIWCVCAGVHGGRVRGVNERECLCVYVCVSGLQVAAAWAGWFASAVGQKRAESAAGILWRTWGCSS